MIKGFDEVQKLGQKNLDQAVKSIGELNKRAQEITDTNVTFSKKAFEEGTAHFEELVTAKSFDQAVDMQAKFARKAFDSYLGQVSKLTDIYAGMARNMYKPLTGSNGAKRKG